MSEDPRKTATLAALKAFAKAITPAVLVLVAAIVGAWTGIKIELGPSESPPAVAAPSATASATGMKYIRPEPPTFPKPKAVVPSATATASAMKPAATPTATAELFQGEPTPAPPLNRATPDSISLAIKGPPAPVRVGELAFFVLPDGVTETVGHWRVIARSMEISDPKYVERDAGLSMFVETTTACVYDVSVAGLSEGKVFHWATTFEVIGSLPRPGPSPPKPVPPGPVVEGPKRIVVIRESLEPTPEMGRLIVQAQSGPIGQYLADKNHEFESYDKEAKDEDGNPSAYVKVFLQSLGTTKLPAVAIVDIEADRIVHTETLGEHPTAAALLEIVKGHGG